MTIGKTSVRAFALLIAILVLLSAFFVDRNGEIDELGLYNPAYMLAHFGKISYPIYGFFNSTIVHPPVHTGVIGLLNRMHFTWYYAEAVPTAFFFLLSVAAIVWAPFPIPVQLGLLYSIGFLLAICGGNNMPFSPYTTRPEGHIQAAWFAGLVLLEGGRLAGWNRAALFAGGFVLTWAAGLHYYSAPACLGVAVYALYAVITLGWQKAKAPVAMLAGGACLFGIPYLAFYVVPNLHDIVHFIGLTEATKGVGFALARQRELSVNWSHYSHYLPVWTRSVFASGIPLFVVSTVILILIPSTRGLALAALPLELFLYFLAGHKLDSYLIHEVSLFGAAVACGALTILDWSLRRVRWQFVRAAAAPVSAALLAVYLCSGNALRGNPVLTEATVSLEPHVHEGDVARAAARKMLGPHATVGGRLCLWYASGADHWYDIESDVLWYPQPRVDLKGYWDNFDALAEDQFMSWTTSNDMRATLSSWYADGTLKLRAFFLGETNPELQIVYLNAQAPVQLTGYALRHGQLYRFEQYADGDYMLVSAVCPDQTGAEKLRKSATFSAMLYLPVSNPSAPPTRVVLVALAPTHGDVLGQIEHACQVRTRTPGSLYLDDRDALVDDLRRTDTPMHFDRELKALPSYKARR